MVATEQSGWREAAAVDLEWLAESKSRLQKPQMSTTYEKTEDGGTLSLAELGGVGELLVFFFIFYFFAFLQRCLLASAPSFCC